MLCSQQNWVTLVAIMQALAVDSGLRMARFPNFWIWQRHVKMEGVTICFSERGNQTDSALHSFLPFVDAHFDHISLSSHKNLGDQHDFMAHFWKATFSYYIFVCLCSILRCQTLQWAILGDVVYKNIPFMQLQFRYFLLEWQFNEKQYVLGEGN